MLKNSLLLLILIISLFSGCLNNNKPEYIIKNMSIPKFETTQELKKFTSPDEIREFLRVSSSYNQINYYRKDMLYSESSATALPVATSAPPTVSKSGTSDYSKTNIQVEGVDEADIVKNDGKYIYVLAQNKLVIIDAYPAKDAKILSETKISGTPVNMFINEDRLVVFTQENKQNYIYSEYSYMPSPIYTQQTVALVYDISNRNVPKEITNYSINGNYFQSRMIGEYVYFIVKDSVSYYDDIINIPAIKQKSVKIMMPDVYYFDNPEQNYVFHTIASFNINSENNLNAQSFLMGYSDNLYVSENNIYITYKKNMPYLYYQTQQEERFYKVVVPALPEDVQNKIYEIKNTTLNSFEKWDKISSILEDTYNKMSSIDKQNYLNNVQKAIEEYDIRLAHETDKTIIHKIGIKKGLLEYKTKGEIQGSLLNQFSMDEFGEYFRVATTSQLWTGRGSVQYNNVYIMNNSLSVIGKLEEIAPDERIYSTRFIGNRLYMVTFQRIDPLFVIDLSNSEKPEILGELKIPGFSDYLHPYDENHIIGIGKETGSNEWGGVSIKGVKISLFDVSDVKAPKQIDMYEIGSSGTDSEALRDHKAFLFDKNKNLLVIPVREIQEVPEYDARYGYIQKVWQGAYVFGVTLDGFKLKGKVSHLDGLEEEMYYWNSPSAVRRSVYINDVLYTVSQKKILMNSIENVSIINRIELPFDIAQYYNYRWY